MDENEIVEALCVHLQGNGHTIVERRRTTDQGVDIVARHAASGRMVYIEAKGGTSSRQGSARFGKAYTDSQIFNRVAKGVYTALALRAQHPRWEAADVVLAVPASAQFTRYLAPVLPQLRMIGITVFVVADNKAVRAFTGA